MNEVWNAYPLWGYREYNWCNQAVVGVADYLPQLRSVLGDDSQSSWATVVRTAELIPEPDNAFDRYAVSVRIGNATIGYLPREDSIRFARPLGMLVQRRLIPTTMANIRVRNETRGAEIDYSSPSRTEFSATVEIVLGDPHLILPSNDSPAEDYTLLPLGYSIQVTKADQHFDILRPFIPTEGETWLIVTLHDLDLSTSRTTKHVVEIRLNGDRIGQLTPATSLKYLPAISHFDGRGLVTAARAMLKGSAVAATVSMYADKAHELENDFLNGDPVTVPALYDTKSSSGPSVEATRAIQRAPESTPATATIQTDNGSTPSGSKFSIAAISPGVSLVSIVFVTPLTPWQLKEGRRLADAAASKLARSGGATARQTVDSEGWAVAVPSADCCTFIGAVAAIENSDFQLVKDYVLRH